MCEFFRTIIRLQNLILDMRNITEKCQHSVPYPGDYFFLTSRQLDVTKEDQILHLPWTL